MYFADWKSDTRVRGRTYDRETLQAHVEAEYREQVAVYTAAVVRMLRIEDERTYNERFGGFFYLFVRGMHLEKWRGQYFERLDWEDVDLLCRQLRDKPPEDAVRLRQR